MKTKLWQTPTSTLHPLVEHYTVGNDQALDQQLLGYDIEATKAHVNMLAHIGVLKPTEQASIVTALQQLLKEWKAGVFTVGDSHEDGHTAIELYLTDKLGSVGKKVHTGRSRNDQALVMMRLYLKSQLALALQKLQQLDAAFDAKIHQVGDQQMPGYTHTQKAMPTTVKLWLQAYQHAFLDLQSYLQETSTLVDQNPLGSAAGFGVDLPLNRDMTSRELGFGKTQENPMYCGLSRGVFEMIAVQALSPIMIFSGKFAEDMILFTSQEFSFFALPDNMTTGSSIMPHKRNYDVFEIMRATAHGFAAHGMQLAAISGGVGSGYHRDLQLTKAIVMTAFQQALETLDVLALSVAALIMQTDNLSNAMTDELYTVAEINMLVTRGVPFRDAYLQVKQKLQK